MLRPDEAVDSVARDGNLAEGRPPGSGSAWRIRGGYVDLFAVPEGADGAAGRRHHVLRASAGDVLLGLPAMAGLRLIVVGGLAADVEALTAAVLLRSATDAVALEAWCRALAQVAGEAPGSGWLAAACEARTLDAGETLQGDPARMLWVAASAGDLAAWSGVSHDMLLALPPGGWIRAERTATIRIMRLEDAACRDADALGRALAWYHEAIVARLAAAIAAEAACLAARVRSQLQTDAAVLSVGLRQLADGRPATIAPPIAAGADPCLAACRLAGEACGVTTGIGPAPVPDDPETAIERVERIATDAGLRCRRVLLAAGWWRGYRGVMIAFLQGDAGAPCVLLPRQGGYRAIDPLSGAARRVDATVAESLHVEALQVYPVLSDQPVRLRQMVSGAWHGVGGDAGSFLAMAIVTGLLTLLPPLVAGLLFDSIIPHSEAGRVIEIAGGLVVLAVAGACFELTKAAALVRIEGRLSLFAQAALVDRLLRLPARFFAEYAAGDLADRLLGIEEIRRTLTSTTVITLLTGVLSLFSLALIFVLDPLLAALCAGMLGIALAAAIALNLAALRAEREGLVQRGRQGGLIVQFVIGIAKLRVAGAERRAMRVWLDGLAREQASAARVGRMRTWLQVLAAVLPLVGLATLFAGVSLLAGPARLPLGTFMAFIAALGNLLAAVLAISVQLTGALRCIPLYERARPLLSATAEPRAGAGRVASLRGGIELRDVTFRYDRHGQVILDRLSVRIEPQEYVAIVGASGSGKSTLMRLLLGFERPEEGALLFDGTAQEQFDPASLRRAMGVVLQQSRLSPGNLFQNIVGNTGRSLDDAWAAARLAGLAEEIAAMPMGMHTTVLEGGQGLSGGQRQRVLIARALVARPRILLFDEATSALDNRTQDIVSSALVNLPATRLVIAHRLSTIVRADRVLVLDRGRLVQSGSYRELLEVEGPFATLARRQLL